MGRRSDGQIIGLLDYSASGGSRRREPPAAAQPSGPRAEAASGPEASPIVVQRGTGQVLGLLNEEAALPTTRQSAGRAAVDRRGPRAAGGLPTRPGGVGDEQLFTNLVVTTPPKRRGWFGLRESMLLHAVVLAALTLVPILWPMPLPETDYLRVLIYNPPPPPPPLPPKGGGPDKAEPAQPVTPDPPEKPRFSAPVPSEDNELRKEDKAPESEQAGSETGSDLGMEGGMEIFGDAAGVPGGVPGGIPGGVVGGTGDGPVMDYDRAPRPIKMTKPIYPQAAFIKKIEGVVEVEILIDIHGRVFPRRIIRSIPLLDDAALETVRQWLFEPAIKNGRPVSIVAIAPVGFRIY